MPEELPGPCTWLIFSTQWYFCSATASNPPASPITSNDGFSLPRPSNVEPGRDRRGLGDVGALVADRGHHAEHDVLDQVRVEAGVPPAPFVDQVDHQRDRLDAVQRALLALPSRR